MFGLFRRKKKKQQAKVEPKAVEVKKDVVEEEPEVKEEPVVEVKEEKVEEPVVEEVKEEEPKEEKPAAPKRKRKPINHITKHKDGGWQVKKEGAQRALKRFPTQKEAIEFAKNLEKTTDTSYIIHKADGSTRKKTY